MSSKIAQKGEISANLVTLHVGLKILWPFCKKVLTQFFCFRRKEKGFFWAFWLFAPLHDKISQNIL